jgi:hypothetical protein
MRYSARVGSVSEPQQEEGTAGSVGVRPAGARTDGAVSSPSLTAANGPERLLALQGTIGNASVARLVARSERAKETGRPGGRPPTSSASQATLETGALALRQAVVARRATERDRPATVTAAAPAIVATPTPTATSDRRLARSFWGKIWGGVKSVGSAIGSAAVAVGGAVKDAAVAVGGAVKTAAVAVGGAVKDAATWVWDGAKAAGQWAVDWLSKAGTAVWDAIKWFGAGAWTVIKAIGTVLFEKLALLGSLALDFVHFLPFRLWRLIIEGWDLVSGLLGWLWKGVKDGPSWAWVWEGFKAGLNWTIETLIRMLELFGITDALQFVWGLIFHTRNLTDTERAASELVHGKGLIPYWEVRVDEGSYMVKLGKWLNSFKDPNAGERAVTTMHIIQAPQGIDLETIVHELTHVVQYEKVGAAYMPQALHGQASKMGYDYGDLTKALAEGKHYRDFNREQQAQIAEDYYVVATTGTPGRYKATAAELDPFIVEMRKGEF